MRRLLLAGLPLLLAAIALSQQGSGSVSGTVIHAASQQPLSGVIVQATGGGQATTDESGRFTITNVPPGTYPLLALKSGMARPQRDSSPRAVTVEVGERVSDLRLQLMPLGTVRGRVTDDAGKPVGQASVSALVSEYQKGRRVLVMPTPLIAGDNLSIASTTVTGDYQLTLPPGRYYIRVERNCPRMTISSFGARCPGETGIYYPSIIDEKLAAIVDVRGGDQIPGIDVRTIMSPGELAKVSGRILADAEGIPDSGQLTLYPRDDLGQNVRGSLPLLILPSLPSRDTFEVNDVPQGSYDLSVSASVSGTRQYGVTAIEVRGDSLEGVVVRLRPPQDVSGRVTLTGPRGSLALDKLTVMSVNYTRVEGDGTFTLKNIPEGKRGIGFYDLPQDVYISDIRQGSRSLFDSAHTLDGPEFEVGNNTESLQITLGTDGGVVDGRIENAVQQPVAAARVVLVPSPSRRFVQAHYKAVITDKNGSFNIRGIAPGVYQVFAWESVPETAWLNPEFLATYEGAGTTVVVDSGRHVSARVRLLPPVD